MKPGVGVTCTALEQKHVTLVDGSIGKRGKGEAAIIYEMGQAPAPET
jgi:hypothetical protein